MAYHGQYPRPPGQIPLKEMYVSTTSIPSVHHEEYIVYHGNAPHPGYIHQEGYAPLPHANLPDHELARLETRDQRLKHRIRVLRFISRTLAAILSAVTLTPLLATIIKFLQTKDTYYNVNGEERTAWAKDTITWYTYGYATISGVSFLFNLAIVLAYCRGVKEANKVSSWSGHWTRTLTGFHIVVWIVSVALYRYGKEPVNGKFRDLWGWTCSSTAQKLQDQLTDVDFKRYCTVQTTSFYSGLVHVVTELLTVLITFLAFRRRASKKKVRVASGFKAGHHMEPLRT